MAVVARALDAPTIHIDPLKLDAEAIEFAFERTGNHPAIPRSPVDCDDAAVRAAGGIAVR